MSEPINDATVPLYVQESPLPSQQLEGQFEVEEPFVPKPRYRMQRSTRVLAGCLLVAVGFFGGVVVNKTVDGGNSRSGRSQFQNAGFTGGGAGGTGGTRTGRGGTGSASTGGSGKTGSGG
ncbi:MAG: hypothetical protein HIU81_03530 [Acidobacteria bacterium]|nr:hypothetical protein [Acidobacteriota bacterium]